jgi:hypothetical protein
METEDNDAAASSGDQSHRKMSTVSNSFVEDKGHEAPEALIDPS